MASNYTSNSASDLFYKVSFVTTHSNDIPRKMKQTGALIVMDNVDESRKSLWFRGDLIASGWGFSSGDEFNVAYNLVNNLENIFGGPNGMWDFVNGYTSDKNEQGSSLWDRFKDAYNYTYNVYENLSYGVSYAYQLIDNAYKYTQSYVSYFTQFNNEFYSYVTYNNDKYDELIDNVYTYAKDSRAYMDSYMDLVYQTLYAYTGYCYALGWETDQYIYESAYAYAGNLSYNLKNYTDRRFQKLIGGAPETLDSLGEIVYLLSHARELGVDTVDRVGRIQNSYVTHEPKDANGYCYLSNQAWEIIAKAYIGYKVVDNGNPWVEDPAEWDKIQAEWHHYEELGDIDEFYNKYKEIATYTYFTYETGNTGYIALKTDQVSSSKPFGSYQLTYLLTKILPPYDYNIPEIKLTPKSEYDLNNTICEVGTTQTINFGVLYNLKDSKGFDLTFEDNNTTKFSKANINSNYDSNLIYYSESKSHYYAPDTNDNINIVYTLSDYPFSYLPVAVMNFKESQVRLYPEIKDILSIEDIEHIIPAGEISVNLFKNVRIPTRYRYFWWSEQYNETKEDRQAYIDNIDLSQQTTNLITSETFKSKIMPFGNSVQYLYFAIPKIFENEIISLKLENFSTGISVELTDNGTSSNEFTLTEYNKEYNNIEYIIYEYQTNRFYLDSKVRFVCELSSMFP